MSAKMLRVFLFLSWSLGILGFWVAGSNQELHVNAQSNSTPKIQECDDGPFAKLNEEIQKRFLEPTLMFGGRRVYEQGAAYSDHRVFARFFPKNQSEKDAMAELRKETYEAFGYVVGRRVLSVAPNFSKWKSRSGLQYYEGLISPPFIISDQESHEINKATYLLLEELPQPWELWEQAKVTMIAFSTRDHYEFSVGKWKFLAKPVRASQKSCLECHQPREAAKGNELKLNDPFGAVFYAYTRPE